MIKWIGIIFLYILPFGYLYLMKVMNKPVEWFVFGFILFMAVSLTLLATVFKKSIEDKTELKENLVMIIIKVIWRGISGFGS